MQLILGSRFASSTKPAEKKVLAQLLPTVIATILHRSFHRRLSFISIKEAQQAKNQKWRIDRDAARQRTVKLNL